jgi:hypothetical protein
MLARSGVLLLRLNHLAAAQQCSPADAAMSLVCWLTHATHACWFCLELLLWFGRLHVHA